MSPSVEVALCVVTILRDDGSTARRAVAADAELDTGYGIECLSF